MCGDRNKSKVKLRMEARTGGQIKIKTKIIADMNTLEVSQATDLNQYEQETIVPYPPVVCSCQSFHSAGNSIVLFDPSAAEWHHFRVCRSCRRN